MESKEYSRLCKGAENSPEPAKCFNRVMHGGIIGMVVQNGNGRTL